MNKKRIILLTLILIFACAILYILFIPKINKHSDSPKPAEIMRPTFKSPSGPPPLSIRTDKKVYSYGEKVDISVSKGSFSETTDPSLDLGNCKISIARTENRAMEQNYGINLEKIYIFNDASQECKDYNAKFVLSLEDAPAKNTVWDQRSCEDSLIPAPAIPDDYSIMVSCEFSTPTEGKPSGVGDSTNIRIEEPQSCFNKKIEITRSGYNAENKLEIGIKNVGTSDIDSIKMYLDKCDDKRRIGFEKRIGKILAGETKTEIITENLDCKYALISAHIEECYDGSSNSWATNPITNP